MSKEKFQEPLIDGRVQRLKIISRLTSDNVMDLASFNYAKDALQSIMIDTLMDIPAVSQLGNIFIRHYLKSRFLNFSDQESTKEGFMIEDWFKDKIGNIYNLEIDLRPDKERLSFKRRMFYKGGPAVIFDKEGFVYAKCDKWGNSLQSWKNSSVAIDLILGFISEIQSSDIRLHGYFE